MDEFDQMIAEFIEGKRKNAQDPDILDRSKMIGDISEMIKVPLAGRRHSRHDEHQRRLRHPCAGLHRRKCLDQGREDHPELHRHRQQDGVEEGVESFLKSEKMM